MYHLDDYNYHLPEALIAQTPLPQRDLSRLLYLERTTGKLQHTCFQEIVDLIQPGDVVVVNNTSVIPARLFGKKESGGKIEVLILDYACGATDKVFECLVKASKRPAVGSRLLFAGGIHATVRQVRDHTLMLDFSAFGDVDQVLTRIGHIPLPPYIRRHDTRQDRTTYQTVYAAAKGAVAAPTAGLHFTDALLDQMRNKGVCITPLTLHVGYGTFVPVRVEDIRQHRMHSEWFDLSAETAAAVNHARQEGHRVVAVGTTCVRTLEYCADDRGMVQPARGACDLFIYPGYRYKVVDAMITNFHLPRSTLLMLVSAFAGRENVFKAYAEAVRLGYRFFSYGDAMLII